MSDEVGAKPCPHCSTESRGRDFAPVGEWRCHVRPVGRTPTRDEPQYPWTRLPDHGDSGLYQHGPPDTLAGMHEMVTSQLFREAVVLSDGFGEQLKEWQARDARRNVVQFLALHPHLWGYVKLKMRLAGTPRERVLEIRGWLESARKMRDRLIEASKREAARLSSNVSDAIGQRGGA